MTLFEAERIFDVVTDALQRTDHRHIPVSALHGYDIYDICTALKLRIANEFLLLAHRDDFEEQFANGLSLYDSGPMLIAMRVVPDDQVDVIGAIGVFNPIDPATLTFGDPRWAAEETASSFGEYCKRIGQDNPLYWQRIYTRLDLEYTAASPRGNRPFIPDDVYEKRVPSDPSGVVTSYLAAASVAALLSAILTGLFAGLTIVVSESTSWILSLANVSLRPSWGIMMAVLSPLFVKMVASISPSQKEGLNQLDSFDMWHATIVMSFSFAALAYFLKALSIFKSEYAFLLLWILFTFCYSEMLPLGRQKTGD